jgi:hypothetical protein
VVTAPAKAPFQFIIFPLSICDGCGCVGDKSATRKVKGRGQAPFPLSKTWL